MVSRNNKVSSSYSCPMDCGPTYDVWGTIPSDPLFNGQSGQGSVVETASWNYGYTMGPYPVGADWSADQPIVSFGPSSETNMTLNAVDAGRTDVTAFVGWRDRYDWDGLECIFDGSFPEAIDAILDILLAVQFRDVHLENTNHSTAFIPAVNTAVLNIDTRNEPGPDACGGDNFVIKVRFDLPSETGSCCNNAITNFVLLTADNKFHFTGDPDWHIYDSPPRGEIFIPLKRNLNGSGTTNSVRISVGGTYQNGDSFRGQGTVKLKCEE